MFYKSGCFFTCLMKEKQVYKAHNNDLKGKDGRTDGSLNLGKTGLHLFHSNLIIFIKKQQHIYFNTVD